MSTSPQDNLFARLLHHYGSHLAPGDSVIPPIVPTAVFHLPGTPSDARYQYGRFHNPTWEALEEALSLLEGAETVIFPSGMAAICAALMSSAKSGARLLLPSDGYYTTRALIETQLAGMNFRMETRPTARFLEGGFAGLDVVFVETPSNPGLDVCDLAVVSAEAKKAGAFVIADNTTMTPLGQRPLDLGADVIVNADTKAINGHSDALLGHVSSRDPGFCNELRSWRRFAGATPGPFEAWQVYRGLETLEVRYERMCHTAERLASALEGHPALLDLRYPGLTSHPGHAIARRQMSRFGSMLTLTLKDGTAAERFIRECPLVQPSTSFGGVRTCAERRERWGDAVPQGFVRLSVGIEPPEALHEAVLKTLKNLS
jgi:cystathionine gamma-lyase